MKNTYACLGFSLYLLSDSDSEYVATFPKFESRIPVTLHLHLHVTLKVYIPSCTTFIHIWTCLDWLWMAPLCQFVEAKVLGVLCFAWNVKFLCHIQLEAADFMKKPNGQKRNTNLVENLREKLQSGKTSSIVNSKRQNKQCSTNSITQQTTR